MHITYINTETDTYTHTDIHRGTHTCIHTNTYTLRYTYIYTQTPTDTHRDITYMYLDTHTHNQGMRDTSLNHSRTTPYSFTIPYLTMFI